MKGMRIGRAPRSLALVVVVMLAFAAPPTASPAYGAEEADRSSEGLDRLRRAIEKSRQRVSRHEKKERDVLEILEQIDQQLESTQSEVEEALVTAVEARAVLAEVESKLTLAKRELARTRRSMSKRAVALYKAGEVGPVRVLFASASLPELLSRAWALERLLRYDADLVGRFKRDYQDLRAVEREAEIAARLRNEAIARLETHRTNLEAEQRVKREIFAAVRGDRTQERALLVELERAAWALEETLASLGEQGRDKARELDGAGFLLLRGVLPSPVEGRVQQSFGRVVDTRFQTETFRKGIEFAARAGDWVRAVARGQVRFAGWFRGYGKIVIVDHGDGYFTVSGHLEKIFVAVHDAVRSGEPLGTVGETGSLSGPSLYFEIRAAGQPLDPAEWIEQAS